MWWSNIPTRNIAWSAIFLLQTFIVAISLIFWQVPKVSWSRIVRCHAGRPQMKPASYHALGWCLYRFIQFSSGWIHINLVGGLVAIFYFPIYIGNNHPNWLSYFSEGFKAPTSYGFHPFWGWRVLFCLMPIGLPEWIPRSLRSLWWWVQEEPPATAAPEGLAAMAFWLSHREILHDWNRRWRFLALVWGRSLSKSWGFWRFFWHCSMRLNIRGLNVCFLSPWAGIVTWFCIVVDDSPVDHPSG